MPDRNPPPHQNIPDTGVANPQCARPRAGKRERTLPACSVRHPCRTAGEGGGIPGAAPVIPSFENKRTLGTSRRGRKPTSALSRARLRSDPRLHTSPVISERWYKLLRAATCEAARLHWTLDVGRWAFTAKHAVGRFLWSVIFRPKPHCLINKTTLTDQQDPSC